MLRPPLIEEPLNIILRDGYVENHPAWVLMVGMVMGVSLGLFVGTTERDIKNSTIEILKETNKSLQDTNKELKAEIYKKDKRLTKAVDSESQLILTLQNKIQRQDDRLEKSSQLEAHGKISSITLSTHTPSQEKTIRPKKQEMLSTEASKVLVHLSKKLPYKNNSPSSISSSLKMERNSVADLLGQLILRELLIVEENADSRESGYAPSLTVAYKLTSKGKAYVVNNGLLSQY